MNAVLDESKRPIAQISIDTRVLIDRLEKSAEGEVIPAAILERDGDEHGIGADLREMLAAVPKPKPPEGGT